jgi:hypothetical protein
MAVQTAITPAHRELIDMVMAIKDSGCVSQLEHVSKTKIRGVLALLKHGEMLVTHGKEGEAVKLYLAAGISTFRGLRDKHDAFLSRYIFENQLFIPVAMRSELLWQINEETKLQRLEAISDVMFTTQQFYQHYLAQTATTSRNEISIELINSQQQLYSGDYLYPFDPVPNTNRLLVNETSSRLQDDLGPHLQQRDSSRFVDHNLKMMHSAGAYSSVNDVPRPRAEQRTYSHRHQPAAPYGSATYYAHGAAARIDNSLVSTTRPAPLSLHFEQSSSASSTITSATTCNNYDLDYLLKADSFLPPNIISELEEIHETGSHGVLAQESNTTFLSQGSGIASSSIFSPHDSILPSVLSSAAECDDQIGLHVSAVNAADPSTANSII